MGEIECILSSEFNFYDKSETHPFVWVLLSILIVVYIAQAVISNVAEATGKIPFFSSPLNIFLVVAVLFTIFKILGSYLKIND